VNIQQVYIRAYPKHNNSLRNPGSRPMKEFVEGTAIKITMIISEITATCTISIDDPMAAVLVDDVGMTKEADYVYSYVYQTTANHFGEGDWVVTLKATYDGITMLTQDRFSLLDNQRTATS